MITIKCKKCGIEKKSINFYKKKESPNGKQPACKTCVKQRVKEYRDNCPDQHKNRHLRKTYGITIAKYREMMDSQNGKCPICKDTYKSLVIDHDHKRGGIRGLICRSCNSMLGMSKDNSSTLLNAIKYLIAYMETL